MVNVAMYDAVNGVGGGRRHALVPGPGPRDADPQAADVAAAHAVLTRLDPDRAATYDARLAADLALCRGLRRGRHPRRRRDPGGRQACHVPVLVAARRLGPAGRGAWVEVALGVATDRELSLERGTRLLALLAMALADTTVATVDTKATYRHWRPATAIREADTDGNPLTPPDPAWAPRAGSVGGTPEYVCGHSSYSGAAAAVLAGFFCADGIPFAYATDSATGGDPRSYAGFWAAAAEAGARGSSAASTSS